MPFHDVMVLQLLLTCRWHMWWYELKWDSERAWNSTSACPLPLVSALQNCRMEWIFLATWDFDGIFNAGLQAQEDKTKTSLRLKKSRSKPSINYLSKSPVMGFRSHLSPTSTFRSRIPSIPRLRSHCHGLQVDPKSMGSTSVRPPLEVHRFDVDPIVVTFSRCQGSQVDPLVVVHGSDGSGFEVHGSDVDPVVVTSSWYLRDKGLEVRTNWLTVDRWQVSKSSIPWIPGASRELNLSTNASRIFSNSSKLSSVFKPVGSCKNHPVWINLQIVCVNDSTKVFDSSQHWDVVARHSQTSRTRCLTSWDR